MRIYVLPGVVILGLIVPLQYFFGYLISKNKVANSFNVDQRVSLVQEVLPAIKTVKYYTWEKVRVFAAIYLTMSSASVNVVDMFSVENTFCIYELHKC